MLCAVVLEGTHAANDGQAHTAFVILGMDNFYKPDFSGGCNVRCATGTDINIRNGNDAYLPVNFDFAAIGKGGKLRG